MDDPYEQMKASQLNLYARINQSGSNMKAKFDSLGRDLYWSIISADGERIRWIGYDDKYWWDEVSKTDDFQIRESPAGNRYRLDPRTNEVKVLDKRAQP